MPRQVRRQVPKKVKMKKMTQQPKEVPRKKRRDVGRRAVVVFNTHRESKTILKYENLEIGLPATGNKP